MRIVLLGFAGVLALLFAATVGLWLYWFKSDVPIDDLKIQYGDAHSHYILVAGHRIHYRDEGPKNAPVVVLVHGFGDNFGTWDGWVAPLSRDYRLIRIDLPGHGLTTSPPDTGIDAQAFADLIIGTLDHIGAARFTIAGNSLGGAVAWQTAVRHPDRVTALVLIDAAGWAHPPAKNTPLVFRLLQYRWVRAILATIDNTPLIVSSLKGEVGNSAVITNALVTRWARLQLAPGHRPILLLNPGKDVATATPVLLSKIKAPTLILWGSCDPVLPVTDADAFARAISKAQAIRYTGVGHLPQIEIPIQSARDVANFLRAEYQTEHGKTAL